MKCPQGYSYCFAYAFLFIAPFTFYITLHVYWCVVYHHCSLTTLITWCSMFYNHTSSFPAACRGGKGVNFDAWSDLEKARARMSAIRFLGNENVHTLICKHVLTFWKEWTFILYKVGCFKEFWDHFFKIYLNSHFSINFALKNVHTTTTRKFCI